MKVQFQIIFFILCLNLSMYLVHQLGIAGTQNMPATETISPEQIKSKYDMKNMTENWQPSINIVPIIGDIFSAAQTLFTHIYWIVAGFPLFLRSLGDMFITDPAAHTAYNYITGAIEALFIFLMSFWIIEFIGGRLFTE